MAAYCFFNNVSISDPKAMETYKARTAEIVKKYQGEYLVIGGDIVVKEGTPKFNYPVLIKFPSLRLAEAWYTSSEYRPFLELRKRSGVFDAFFIEGLDQAATEKAG